MKRKNKINDDKCFQKTEININKAKKTKIFLKQYLILNAINDDFYDCWGV